MVEVLKFLYESRTLWEKTCSVVLLEDSVFVEGEGGVEGRKPFCLETAKSFSREEGK